MDVIDWSTLLLELPRAAQSHPELQDGREPSSWGELGGEAGGKGCEAQWDERWRCSFSFHWQATLCFLWPLQLMRVPGQPKE